VPTLPVQEVFGGWHEQRWYETILVTNLDSSYENFTMMNNQVVLLLLLYLMKNLNKSLAIQQNRDPIGYTKRTRRYPLVKQQHALLGSAFNSGGCSTSGTPFPDSSSTPFPGSSSMAMAGCSSTSSASFMNSLGPGPSSSRASQHHQQPQPPMSAEQVQEDLLLQRLINVENILLTIRQNANFLSDFTLAYLPEIYQQIQEQQSDHAKVAERPGAEPFGVRGPRVAQADVLRALPNAKCASTR
jgi:hypothetical protein